MTDSEARQVLLLRAAETAGAEPPGCSWTAADATWASAEALRLVGEGKATGAPRDADAEAFLVQRARLGLRRLADRDGVWKADAGQPLGLLLWVGAALLVAALLFGIAADSLASGQRINLLAPPLLGLLLWNVAVYLALLVAALRLHCAPAGKPAAEQAMPSAPNGRQPALRGALVALALRLARRLAPRHGPRWATAARARAVAEWVRVSAALQQQRAAAWLHAAAALLALGAVLSMYGRGLVLDYRAGWDSTFLGAPQVRAILGAVLGPAAAVSGLSLPDTATIAALRWADGGRGDSAARWIHLYALTLGAAVVLPRLLLAGVAALRASRAAARIRLPLDEPYFRGLLRQRPAAQQAVTVLPYSYRLGAAQRAGLAAALGAALGIGAQPQLADSLPMGVEDDLAARLPATLADQVVALFALTATPERETHGAFVRALAAALPERCALQVVVDESVFRQRLAADDAGAPRLQQRREAWQRLLHDLSLPAPRFADLTAGAAA